MIYLLALFASPIALFVIGKPFQGIVNLVFYLAAWVFLITIVLFWPLGIGAWAIGAVHAILAINSHKADKRNRALIDAMKGGKP